MKPIKYIKKIHYICHLTLRIQCMEKYVICKEKKSQRQSSYVLRCSVWKKAASHAGKYTGRKVGERERGAPPPIQPLN